MDESVQILIVENDRAVARGMQHALKRMGYGVPAVLSSGEEAVKRAGKLKPDLVLVDAALEGDLDGVKVAALIRTRFDIPVVYITGDVDEAGIKEITRTQPFGCVFKPLRDADLQAAVEIALNRHIEERRLREGEKKYRAIVEGIEDGYWETDLAGRLTFANDAMCAMAEVPRKELLRGVRFTNYADSETAERVGRIFEEVYRTGKSSKLGDHRIRRRDGTTGVFQFNVSLMRDTGGVPIGFRGISRDVTERRVMERALQESEEQYRTILESIEDGYCEADLAGRFTFFNDALCRMMGFSREELFGMSYLQYTDSETAKRLYEVFNGVYRTGRPANIVDYDVIKKDKNRRTHEASVSLMRDGEGTPIGFRGISRDVTERKAMENALRESEERYRTILESIEDGYWEMDLKGRFTFFNDAFCRLHGLPAEQLMGMSYRKYIPPEIAERPFKIFSEVYRTGKPTSVVDFEILRKDGSRAIHELSISPMKDSGGATIGFRGISRDITARKKDQANLERYRDFLEGISDACFETDLKGNIIFANKAAASRSGITPAVMVGDHYSRYTATPEEVDRLYTLFHEVYLTGKSSDVNDCLISDREERTRFVDMSVSLIRDTGGKPTGFRVISRDVTERKKAQGALRESEKLYRTALETTNDGVSIVQDNTYVYANQRLLSTIGRPNEDLIGKPNGQFMHPDDWADIVAAYERRPKGATVPSDYDIRILKPDGSIIHVHTVATEIIYRGRPAVLSFIVDITRRKQAEEEIKNHREHLALINQILRHDLANDLFVIQNSIFLHMQSPEEGFLEDASERVKKSMDLISRMKELESFVSSYKDLKVWRMRDVMKGIAKDHPSVDFTIKGRARVMADDSLFSVIDNIVRNAVIHGKADRIDVAIEREDGMCKVRIADNGSGIPDEIKETIFEEGFRHGKTGQTGLGLHIVRKAMDKYGGQASVGDNDPNGAVFTLRFRMAE